MNYFDVINGYTSDVLLLNGCHSDKVSDMHNVRKEDFTMLQGSVQCDANDITPSPRGSDSGIESDCADGNLSWLLNYKIQELPPVPDAATETVETNNKTNPTFGSAKSNTKQTIIEEEQKYANQHRYSGSKKPPFTYTELIEHALSEKGELTVSGIYHWISDHFPFYKQNDDRWKNSVRHNLSINPHFRKGGKAVHGAGHFWTISQKDDNKTWKMRQRIQQFLQSTNQCTKDAKPDEQEAFESELQAATQSILGEIESRNSNTVNGDEIHVEFINVTETPNGLEDFLAPPVPPQDLVNECGLGGDFFITDINPNTLGLNLADNVAEDIIYDEISFEYYGMK
ncbi:uncharacterized protein LOC132700958 isoform X2 [Cylas formicarius]|uniref:uncharacterized protein LOC132700958 isoform X2 n=1 Tax=Cylas formicarius TaxID=197179 RepID=UPI0029587CED|nr:uncharacterized protein LOC132700958 isoform X2 [Cylas formicarius]